MCQYLEEKIFFFNLIQTDGVIYGNWYDKINNAANYRNLGTKFNDIILENKFVYRLRL